MHSRLRLLTPMPAGGQEEIYINLEEEEAISLEPFGALLSVCLAQQKTFLLARVVTEDTEGTIFHSFYAAHYLNKVIFRQHQRTKNLVRVKTQNPLNNILIERSILYYAVDPPSKDCGGGCLHTGILYATDLDFATKMGVREFFRQNAVAKEDMEFLEFEQHDPGETENASERLQTPTGRARRFLQRNGPFLLFFFLVWSFIFTIMLVGEGETNSILVIYFLLVVAVILGIVISLYRGGVY